MNSLTRADMRDQLSNIDQIRDILFGSQLRDYTTRIDQIEANLSSLQYEIRDRTDEIKQTLSSELQTSVEAIDKKLKSMALKDNDEKIDIRQQIDLLSKRLSSNVERLDETIDQQIGSLRDDFLTSREKIQDDLQGLRAQVFEELEKRVTNLTESKIAKADMAEMLFEVGLRLKGTEFVPELRGAVDTSELSEDDSPKKYLLPEDAMAG